ncbi:MAG: RNA 3'-phosphate cyclase, partial [Candidatus Aenigmarchaeota archaeon]|nr:RNA 3'-phosphate cyclase [Candidatus Aenigmarchaeota archaeon]
YTQFVLLPLLRRMGHHAEINIIRHGFYPVGGARVKVMIEPCRGLDPIDLRQRGDVISVEGVSVASSGLKKPRVAERQARTIESALSQRGYDCALKTRYVESSSPGSGVILVARTANGCVLGSDGLGEMGKPAEVVAEEAVDSLLRTIDSGATVDVHVSDQMLPYMALANKGSCIIAPSLTNHARTNMWVIQQFLPVEFNAENSGGNVRIECVPSA